MTTQEDTGRHLDPSALAEDLGTGPGFWQLGFNIGSRRRVAAVTRCRERRLDLPSRQVRHLRVAARVCKQDQGDASMAGARGRLERHVLAGPFLQGLALGRDGLTGAIPSARDRCQRRKNGPICGLISFGSEQRSWILPRPIS